ncbi:MAG TPA: hypothetical protein VKU38_20055 [Ktedonobacteraceae bacterium]|nr:hypothetical protein [Ktedonobacteraceae bacterium]
MTSRGRHTPNTILRRLREERGWSLRRVADELCLLAEAENENRIPGVNANMVGVWERGWKRPSPFYQALFCQLYHRTASQLGFVHEADTVSAARAEGTPRQEVKGSTIPIAVFPQLALTHEQTHAIDLLCQAPEAALQQQAGAWLTLGASDLSQLFHEGWTLDEILASLQVVLQGMQSTPAVTRRHLLQLGGAAMISSIPIPVGERVSEEGRAQFTRAIGESIGAAWKLFHSANIQQVLAIGQTQLYFLNLCHSELLSSMQPLLYSLVYRLIGAALHYQGRYGEAFKAHNQAYLTALEGADVWNMAQSRIWQVYELKEQEQYEAALQMQEMALRLVSTQNTIECIRTTAHLHTSGAEIAALMNDAEGVQTKLSASDALLEYLSGSNDEFDRASWYEVAGVCALHLKQFDVAAKRLNQAIETQSPRLLLRKASTLMPLVMAYAHLGERDASLEVAEKAIPLINTINASGMNRQFVEYTTYALSEAFPGDAKVLTFVATMQHQLLPHRTTT